ncbi:MAG: transposase [Caldilineaceae bacterium SB0666_bin_21]|nr:transposase [Caldilineaceae bacterium SB0666_bin_21]
MKSSYVHSPYRHPRPCRSGHDCYLAGPSGGRSRPSGTSPGHGPQARQALAYLDGLPTGRSARTAGSCWKSTANADPYGIQYLLNRERWSVAEAQTALCCYVRAYLGDTWALGIIDETTFLKKGTYSTEVTQKYSSSTGREENCALEVFLAEARTRRNTLQDAEL